MALGAVHPKEHSALGDVGVLVVQLLSGRNCRAWSEGCDVCGELSRLVRAVLRIFGHRLSARCGERHSSGGDLEVNRCRPYAKERGPIGRTLRLHSVTGGAPGQVELVSLFNRYLADIGCLSVLGA